MGSQAGCVFSCGFDLIKHWILTSWIHIKPFLSVVLISSNMKEGLTRWTQHIQPFSQWYSFSETQERYSQPGCMFSHSCLWFWSAQTLERDSLAVCMFSHSCQCFWSAQTLERDSHSACKFSHSCQYFWSAQTQEKDSHPRCVSAIHVSGSDLLKHWRGLTSWMCV